MCGIAGFIAGRSQGGLPGCGHIAAELRDELLNGEIFYSLKEAPLHYRPPAPQTFAPLAHHLDEIIPMQ